MRALDLRQLTSPFLLHEPFVVGIDESLTDMGILSGGRVGDLLLRRRYLNGRILVAGVSALATVVLFIPALITRSSASARIICTARSLG